MMKLTTKFRIPESIISRLQLPLEQLLHTLTLLLRQNLPPSHDHIVEHLQSQIYPFVSDDYLPPTERQAHISSGDT